MTYPSPCLTYGPSVHETANNELERLKIQGVFEQYKEIYFITHSMGGLVVKSLLTRLKHGEEEAHLRQVRAVIFHGTPAQGVNIATLGKMVCLNPQVGDMKLAHLNPWLPVLEDSWTLLMEGRKTPLYPLAFCAYETKPYYWDILVPREATTSRCDGTPMGLALNHSDMAVPTSKELNPYFWVMGKISETSKGVQNEDPTAKRETSNPDPADQISMYIECEAKPFPQTIPSDGKLKGLVFFHRTPVNSSTATEFKSIGMPGSRTDWADRQGKYAWECQLTNYGTVPVLKVQITFGLRFQDTVWLDSKGSFTHRTKVSEGWTSQIRKIDPWPAERFVFYMKNATNDWLEVTVPEFVELQTLGESRKRTVPLLRPDDDLGHLGTTYRSVFLFTPADWPQSPPADLPER